MQAEISAPTPCWGQPPSTVIAWPVFFTDSFTVSMSRGRMERRLTTWGESRMYLNVIQTIQSPHLTADALLGKNVRSVHGKTHANAVSHQRDVSSSPLDLGLADGQDKVGLHHGVVHVEGCAVEQLVLQEDNGVGVPDGCLQKTLAVLRIIGRDDLDRKWLHFQQSI